MNFSTKVARTFTEDTILLISSEDRDCFPISVSLRIVINIIYTILKVQSYFVELNYNKASRCFQIEIDVNLKCHKVQFDKTHEETVTYIICS